MRTIQLPRRASLIICGFCIIFSALWKWAIAPEVLKLPENFSYSADILSLDNFYDIGTKTFSGEKRSVSRFSYTTTNADSNTATIKNSFNVRNIAGDTIVNVDRTYSINRYTKQHMPTADDITREGYLFGPENSTNKHPFTYWHVNYNVPATMHYVKEESIFGLPTYLYESNYDGKVVDQTKELTGTNGIGTTVGIELEPHLQLWIEPITGMLVKYADKTTAYVYDLRSHKRLHPWNSFRNSYTRASVKTHVENLRNEKFKYLLVSYYIPLCILLIGLLLMLFQYVPVIVSALIICISVVIMGGFLYRSLFTSIKNPIIRVGISRWVPIGNTQYDENIQGFKDALTQAGFIEHEDIEYTLKVASASAQLQRENANFFNQQDFDLVFSQTTPGTAILKEVIQNIPIVFTIVTYPVESGIIASLSGSQNNLVGTRNWVPISEQIANFRALVSDFKRVGFIHRTKESNSSIQLKEMQAVLLPQGISVQEIHGKDLAELTRSLEASKDIDVLYSACDTLVQGEAENTIISYATSKKIPSFSCNNTGPKKGDLMGTVADFYQIGKLAGEKAALILDGASPTSLDTSTVARPYLYINLKTAELLGIRIPQDLLSKAKAIYR